jgi:hypothetical protein
MKALITIIAIASFLTGCETTSYEKGLLSGGVAQVAFDAPQDEAKFQRVKQDIEGFLASGKELTQYVVDQYVVKIQDEFSPALVNLIVERLKLEFSNEFGHIDDDAKEFLQGLADSIK